MINVLQMTHHGMRSLKIHSFVDEKTGEKAKSIHFAAQKIDLGHVVTNSGRVLGPREKNFDIHGSSVVFNTMKNSSKLVLQDGTCRFENLENFQVS